MISEFIVLEFVLVLLQFFINTTLYSSKILYMYKRIKQKYRFNTFNLNKIIVVYFKVCQTNLVMTNK